VLRPGPREDGQAVAFRCPACEITIRPLDIGELQRAVRLQQGRQAWAQEAAAGG
jgi:predicted dinucleotide-binding enzyme